MVESYCRRINAYRRCDDSVSDLPCYDCIGAVREGRDLMLKKYKNRLYQIIQNSGIDLNLVTKREEELEGHDTFTIEIIGTPFYFTVRDSSLEFERFDCRYVMFRPFLNDHISPYVDPIDEQQFYGTEGWSGRSSFSRIEQLFAEWLTDDVKSYIRYVDEQREPDLWTKITEERQVLNLNNIDFNNKEFFNDQEKQQLRTALDNARILIIGNFHPSEDKLNIINRKLDYLSEAINRLNKFDWKSVMITVILDISIALSLDTEKGRQLFYLFKKVFDEIPKFFLSK